MIAHNIDAVNATLWQRSEMLSVAEARAESKRVHSQQLVVLQQLDGEDMLKSNRSYGPLTMGQQDESPVIITISANTTEHYTEHLP